MRELPAGLADQLPQPSRHATEEVIEAELTAEAFGRFDIFRLRRPAASHEQVEGKGFGEHVVFVELGRGDHASSPALGPQGLSIEPAAEQEAGFRNAQAAEQGGQGRFTATGRTVEEEPVARADP
jgi:hypothetical protein